MFPRLRVRIVALALLPAFAGSLGLVAQAQTSAPSPEPVHFASHGEDLAPDLSVLEDVLRYRHALTRNYLDGVHAQKLAEARQRRAQQRTLRAASAATPQAVAISGDYVPPEGCMVPMGPKERKESAEAHRCWDALLARYPWSQRTAFSKMYCESGGNPYAIGPWVTINGKRYRAEGLMQILPGGSHDPATNMAQAWRKYSDAGGWGPWQC